MAIVSMRSKKRFFEVGGAALICVFALLLQMLVLNRLGIHGWICNLPLTITLVWGLVFGSSLPPLTALELRRRSLKDIFLRQLAAGSHSGFLVGWFNAWIYYSIFPRVFPLSFPLLGWASGYFNLRGIGQGNLLCIPLTFVLTIIAEAIISWQLAAPTIINKVLIGANLEVYDVALAYEHLKQFILPEALLNSVVAPFIYFPMRTYADLVEGQQAPFPID
jgi:hypothetical protein